MTVILVQNDSIVHGTVKKHKCPVFATLCDGLSTGTVRMSNPYPVGALATWEEEILLDAVTPIAEFPPDDDVYSYPEEVLWCVAAPGIREPD